MENDRIRQRKRKHIFSQRHSIKHLIRILLSYCSCFNWRPCNIVALPFFGGELFAHILFWFVRCFLICPHHYLLLLPFLCTFCSLHEFVSCSRECHVFWVQCGVPFVIKEAGFKFFFHAHFTYQIIKKRGWKVKLLLF